MSGRGVSQCAAEGETLLITPGDNCPTMRGHNTRLTRRGGGERGSWSQGGNARHDGKSNPLSGGRQGERLTDERDREKDTERGERAPKDLADQRGTPSKIMTMRKGMGGGGAEMERGEDRRGETLIHALIHIT